MGAGMIMDYSDFLMSRAQRDTMDGFEPIEIPGSLMPFQRHLTEWAIRMGRCALFEDCGLGKTLQQLVWADNVVRHTNGRVLILTPLAVAQQTAREAEKFGIEARLALDGKPKPGINIVNYERLHYFDPADFIGIVCDESSILKSFDGVRKTQITVFTRKMPFRLFCTATAAPNDFHELGPSSEALGYLTHTDMLQRFFVSEQNNSIRTMDFENGRRIHVPEKYRFKGHAEVPFWRWVCSWSRALRKPSDMGFDDGSLALPPLTEEQHLVESRSNPSGKLFALPAVGLAEQREERRRTIEERCEEAARLVADTGKPAIIWCQLNDEGDLLEKIIPGAVQVAGADSEEEKERKFAAFLDGSARVLVTKAKIGGWGLNFQHCAHVVSFPTHSFEGYYQSVRRCWRFGQKSPVKVDIVTTEGEKNILANLQRKQVAAERMFAALTEQMNAALKIERKRYLQHEMEMPQWL